MRLDHTMVKHALSDFEWKLAFINRRLFIWFCPGSKKEEKTEIATHLIFDESDPKVWLDL